MCVCLVICMCTTCVQVPVEIRRVCQSPRKQSEGGFESLHVSAGNPCPLKEQQALLTSQPPLQFHHSTLTTVLWLAIFFNCPQRKVIGKLYVQGFAWSLGPRQDL